MIQKLHFNMHMMYYFLRYGIVMKMNGVASIALFCPQAMIRIKAKVEGISFEDALNNF